MNRTMNLQQVKALHLIDRFNPKCVKEHWAFPKIEKSEFLESLKLLVANPASITQGVHPLCGIACALKVAAELDPVGLVKMGAYFFANGKYESRSFLEKSIKVPNKLKVMEPTAGLSAANHVLQTTIKAFYNPVTGYNNKPGTKYNEWQGITFPYQLKRFLKAYFKIKQIPARTYRHTVEEIQELLKKPIMLMAWTSWNQMKNSGGKFKPLQQHYVIIKKVERVGEEVHMIIDNPRKSHDKLQRFKFKNEKDFYKAIIGIYAFIRKDID